eukprot:TRINITY_DN18478_c0_g1_i1.p1 TRINITY_DN18478_c0_g1~~TRINITY_DN18478_c0_g1_i1.p1  ORF type:complete len:353 (+),score=111.02 TRINITY_DN18478_c0_g1_i1:36-1094(+)
MKRRVGNESGSVGLCDISSEIVKTIIFNTLTEHEDHPHRLSLQLPALVCSFSLLSKKSLLLTSTSTFLFSFKHHLLSTLHISHFPSKQESLLLSIFRNNGISLRNVWVYVYWLLAWMERRMRLEKRRLFETDADKICSYFVRSPKPYDLTILSLFLPYSLETHPYVSHLIKTRTKKQYPKLPYSLKGHPYTPFCVKYRMKKQYPKLSKEKLFTCSQAVWDSVGNIFVTSYEESSEEFEKEEVLIAFFTLKFYEEDLFCVVSFNTHAVMMNCTLVNVKEKKKTKIEELEPLVFSIAEILLQTDMSTSYEELLRDKSIGSLMSSPGPSPSSSPQEGSNSHSHSSQEGSNSPSHS